MSKTMMLAAVFGFGFAALPAMADVIYRVDVTSSHAAQGSIETGATTPLPQYDPAFAPVRFSITLSDGAVTAGGLFAWDGDTFGGPSHVAAGIMAIDTYVTWTAGGGFDRFGFGNMNGSLRLAPGGDVLAVSAFVAGPTDGIRFSGDSTISGVFNSEDTCSLVERGINTCSFTGTLAAASTPTPAPEPASAALLLAGVLGLAGARRRG